MRVAIAPDSFKGCLAASEVAEAIANGLKSVWPEVEIACVPLADGGEGTADVWMQARKGEWVAYDCTDGLGRAISGQVGWIDDGRTAIVEAARAVGLDQLTSAERNPWEVSSFGLGELVCHVLAEPRVQTLWLTLGGSATVDGGLGCLQALGIPIETATGDPVPRGGCGLARVARVNWAQMPDRLRPEHPEAIDVRIACDVTNPLLGPTGAARIFGPQKGADPDMVEQLERGMQNWVEKSDRSHVAEIPGAGAAGGLGFALGCLGATFHSGIGCTIEAVNLSEHLQWADWVITGEGRCDRQTAAGKVVSGVLAEAHKWQCPVVVLAGGVDINAVDDLMTLGATAVMAATPAPGTVEDIIASGSANLQWSARNIAGLIQLGQSLGTTS